MKPGYFCEEFPVVRGAAVDVLGDLDDLLQDGELAAYRVNSDVPQELKAHPRLHGGLGLRPAFGKDFVEDVLTRLLYVLVIFQDGQHDDLLILGHERPLDLAVDVFQLVHLPAADGVDLRPLCPVIADVDRFGGCAVGRAQRIDGNHVQVERLLDLLGEDVPELLGILHVDHDNREIDIPCEAHVGLGLGGPAAHVHLRPDIGQVRVELDVARQRPVPGLVDTLLP